MTQSDITPEGSVVRVFIDHSEPPEPAEAVDFNADKEARESAVIKLASFGLTEAEIHALFGL